MPAKTIAALVFRGLGEPIGSFWSAESPWTTRLSPALISGDEPTRLYTTATGGDEPTRLYTTATGGDEPTRLYTTATGSVVGRNGTRHHKTVECGAAVTKKPFGTPICVHSVHASSPSLSLRLKQGEEPGRLPRQRKRQSNSRGGTALRRQSRGGGQIERFWGVRI